MAGCGSSVGDELVLLHLIGLYANKSLRGRDAFGIFKKLIILTYLSVTEIELKPATACDIW